MRPLPMSTRRLLLGMVAAAVAVLAVPPPAAAHGTLAMSTPAEGATVTGPLSAVELYFTERVASHAYFTIIAPGGGRVDSGWTHGSPKPLDKPVREYFLVEGKFEPREYTTGFPAVVTVAHLPAAGQYSVSYLSVASDGDPVRGTLTFRYTGPATPAPQGWSPPTNQPDPALLAAADRHGTPDQVLPTSAAPAPAPASAEAPVAAPPGESDETGGVGWVAWTGWAFAFVVVVAGLVVWRTGGRFAVAKTRSSRSAARPADPRRGRPGGPNSTTRHGTGSRARKTTAAGAGAVIPTTRGGGRVAVRPVNDTPPAGAEAENVVPTVAAARLGPSNTRLALLAGGLVVSLLAGFGLGRLDDGGRAGGGSATVPAGGAPASDARRSAVDGHQHGPGTGPHTHTGDAGAALATGTTVSANGYTLQPVRRDQRPGQTVDYAFRIVGTDRQAATRFATVHDRPLHMIVVGRDLSGYQHLHPTMAADGTWSVPLRLARPGGYRIYADFTVIGADGTTQLPLVLGVDHVVPGAYTPVPVPAAQPQATAGPFAVSMEGTPTVGVMTPLLFRPSRDGMPAAAQLERYLGAYGHLIVVREGDLGYVHVHPEPELVDGAVTFWLTAPSAGRYRAYFDFQVAGRVQTAEYTLDIS
ncbi:copper resistance CopC family protein [Plantactinospora sonchi]|uniref:Copper resistance protein CopC n=1 Tax=Plantactinospora sonchi TaxID=1544735 RepID=A0ABU7S1H7_9ACTN